MWIERILIITVVFIFLQNYIYSKWGFKNINYNRYFSINTAFEGEEIKMIEVIENAKIIPIPWLRIESKIDPALHFKTTNNLEVKYGTFHKSVFTLLPFMKITRTHTIKCTKRGAYSLKNVTLASGSLFGGGDSRKYKDIEIDSTIIVYPQILEYRKINIPTHSWQGNVTVKRWIVNDPFLIAGVRDYTNSDSYNSINWKATARANKLQVHKRDYTAQSRMMILFNIDLREDQWTFAKDEKKLEYGVKLCATYANLAAKRGVEIGFLTNGQLKETDKSVIYLEPKSSNEQLMRILEVLARIKFIRRVSFRKLLNEEIKRANSGFDYLILSAYVSVELKREMRRLESMGNSVTYVPIEGESYE